MALAAACWCFYGAAHAQIGTYPSPVGAARMPEPIPCGPSAAPTPPPPAQPNLIPGPISPQAAPMGPPDCLSLPADHSSAFQCENYVPESGMYFSIGPMALQRNHMGAGDIAVYNARALGQPIGPILPNPFLPPPAGTMTALSFNSVQPALSLGLTGTAGYLWDQQAIEFSSFYIWENDATAFVNAPRQLDTLFFNPPLTFLGDGLWRRADQVSETLGSSLFSAEANYRRWNSAYAGLEFLAGMRFIRQNDILGITTQGTSVIANSLGLPTPGRDMAMYQVICHNNIVAPQLGLEYNYTLCRWLTLEAMGKGAWGVNYLTSDVSLTRGDGLTAFDTMRHATVFAQVYTLGGFGTINILEKLRLRLGFTATWMTGVATANDQVDFNLMGFEARRAFGLSGLFNSLTSGNLKDIANVQQQIPHGHQSNNGSLLYFGPQIEMQFFF